MTDRQQFAAWKRDLRRHFPPRLPVRVLLVPIRHMPRDSEDRPHLGHCFYDRHMERFTIRIADSLSANQTADCLLHEWAHVVRWHLPEMPGDTDHDEVFAALYGRLYRHWFGERSDC